MALHWAEAATGQSSSMPKQQRAEAEEQMHWRLAQVGADSTGQSERADLGALEPGEVNRRIRPRVRRNGPRTAWRRKLRADLATPDTGRAGARGGDPVAEEVVPRGTSSG
jgi:hypothetical protein